MTTFRAKVVEEAANSQEQKFLRPLGDTGQVIAEKENQEFHWNLGRITEKTAGGPGCTAAGGGSALNVSVPFWRIHSEVRNTVLQQELR